MKKVSLFFACFLMLAASSFANTNTPGPKISEKAIKAFKATFTDAENVEWTEAVKKDEVPLYTVKFTQQGIKTFVKYDDEGNFISSRRYYAGEQLPVDIQCKLKKHYGDKTVFGVTETSAGEDTYYYIKLEDAKTWTTVKIDNSRNMDVVERFKKI